MSRISLTRAEFEAGKAQTDKNLHRDMFSYIEKKMSDPRFKTTGDVAQETAMANIAHATEIQKAMQVNAAKSGQYSNAQSVTQVQGGPRGKKDSTIKVRAARPTNGPESRKPKSRIKLGDKPQVQYNQPVVQRFVSTEPRQSEVANNQRSIIKSQEITVTKSNPNARRNKNTGPKSKVMASDVKQVIEIPNGQVIEQPQAKTKKTTAKKNSNKKTTAKKATAKKSVTPPEDYTIFFIIGSKGNITGVAEKTTREALKAAKIANIGPYDSRNLTTAIKDVEKIGIKFNPILKQKLLS